VASVFTHAAVAAAITFVARPLGNPRRFYAAAAFCAVAPDLDVIGFQFGIDYGHVLGHRGLSHSLVAAAALGTLFTWALFRGDAWTSAQRTRALVVFALCTASHGALDALTNGGMGIAFFAPLENSRYFLPWRPIQVSPIGIAAFFSEWGLAVLRSELVVVWLPCAAACGLVALLRRRG